MILSRVTLSGLLVFSLVGCGPDDDPEAARKLEETRQEVASKEKEISEIEKEIKRIRINDPSERLTELKLELKEVEEAGVVLEAEVAALEAAGKKDAEKFEAYRKKYPIRTSQK